MDGDSFGVESTAATIGSSNNSTLSEDEAISAIREILESHHVKIEKSIDGGLYGAKGLWDNIINFLLQLKQSNVRQFFLNLPHLKEFLYKVPAKAYHKLVVNTLHTYLRLSKDHCGKTILK